MREPRFWWRETGTAATLLAPLGAAYGAVAAWRMGWAGRRANIPVLCVGNLTLGGAGKTPTAITVGRLLTQAGLHPFFLSRGYGGQLAGPVLVNPAVHGAADVGDEPLLLARVAPTMVARDRLAGALAAQAAGANVIVMDDGFQNPSLVKHCAILVVDSHRGIGNGHVFPAGPLRAPLDAQLARADAMVVIGDGRAAAGLIASATGRHIPVFPANLEPNADDIAAIGRRPVLGFAGIGDPDKFFGTVTQAGIALAARQPFPDHYRFTGEEAAALIMRAEHDALALLTTEKDRARMVGEPLLAALAEKTHVLPVTLVVDEADELRALMLAKLRR